MIANTWSCILSYAVVSIPYADVNWESTDDDDPFFLATQSGKWIMEMRRQLMRLCDSRWTCESMCCIATGTTSKMATFSQTHVLWVCSNAMNIDHSCTYIKCHGCFKHPKKRSQRKKLKKGKCDHKLLLPFDNEAYYKPPYSQGMENEVNFPKVCVGCEGIIVVTSSVWNKVCMRDDVE